ncbi:MAG: hypothetical protein Q8K99_13975 [Actinomycetota bacterium]|nr:hypothetical protein [Actinomycetota bacterium]
MGLTPGVRRSLAIALTLLLLSVPLVAFAEETPAEPADARDGSFAGTYEVAGSTNTGKPISAVVVVTDLGDEIQFSSEVYGFPVSSTGAAAWNGDEVTVPVSVTAIHCQRIRRDHAIAGRERMELLGQRLGQSAHEVRDRERCRFQAG